MVLALQAHRVRVSTAEVIKESGLIGLVWYLLSAIFLSFFLSFFFFFGVPLKYGRNPVSRGDVTVLFFSLLFFFSKKYVPRKKKNGNVIVLASGLRMLGASLIARARLVGKVSE